MPIPISIQEHVRDLIIRVIHRDLSDLDLSGLSLVFLDLTGADLRRANLTDTAIIGARLKGTDLRGAIGLTPERLVYAKSQGAIVDEPDRPLPSLLHALHEKYGRGRKD